MVARLALEGYGQGEGDGLLELDLQFCDGGKGAGNGDEGEIAASVFAAQDAGLVGVVGEDGDDLGAAEGRVTGGGKLNGEAAVGGEGREDAEVDGEGPGLLDVECFFKRRAVAADELMTAVDDHLRSVDAVETNALLQAFWRWV